MILLYQVIEIFGLAELDRRFMTGIDRFKCGEIGADFSMVTVSGTPFRGDRFLKVTPGRSPVPMGA